jgi:hypothetical protein
MADTWSIGKHSFSSRLLVGTGKYRDFPTMQRAAILASGTPVALPTKGTVREALGFTSSTYTFSSLTANWMFSRPTTPSSRAMRRVCSLMARIHSGLLDVLHDAADQDLSPVADRVHVHLGGVGKEAVEQHRRVV